MRKLPQPLRMIRGAFLATWTTSTLTGDRTYTYPNKDGVVALTSDIPNGNNFSTVLSISSNRTLTSSDVGKFLLCEGTSGITITIPTDTTAIAISSEIEICRDNTGTVTITRSAGVVLSGDGRTNQASFQILNRHGSVSLKKVGSNDWRIFGAIAW